MSCKLKQPIDLKGDTTMSKYEFSNYEYICSHGKNPKGTGHWAFVLKNAAIEGIAPETFIDRISGYRTDTIFWVPGIWTLSEAKKRASIILAANAVPAGTTVYVAP